MEQVEDDKERKMIYNELYGYWKDESVAYPTEIVVFPGGGAYSWQVKNYVSGRIYAASYAPSLERAFEDAHAAVAKGACEERALGKVIWAYGRLLLKDWDVGATAFRQVDQTTWIGYHAGSKLSVITTDERMVPHMTAARIHHLDVTR